MILIVYVRMGGEGDIVIWYGHPVIMSPVHGMVSVWIHGWKVGQRIVFFVCVLHIPVSYLPLVKPIRTRNKYEQRVIPISYGALLLVRC